MNNPTGSDTRRTDAEVCLSIFRIIPETGESLTKLGVELLWMDAKHLVNALQAAQRELAAARADAERLRARIDELERWRELAFDAHPNIDIDIAAASKATR